MSAPTSYKQFALDRPFQAFLWTQFLGAFNDNVFKIVVSLYAVRVTASGSVSSRYLALAGAVFVLPFLLFAGYAGQLADLFSKTRVLQLTKALEVFTMALGAWALVTGRMDLMLAVLFLLAVQANLFSPAKYGILPELMSEAGLSRANGLLELSTFVAIVAGSGFGTWLFEQWKATPIDLGYTLLVIAVGGSLASLGIRYVPAAGSKAAFRWNPFREVAAGAASLRRNRPLLGCVLGISWFWMVGALFQMGLILAAREVLHVSEGQSGLLIAALAAGIGIGSVVAGSVSGDHIELGLVPAGALAMGVCSIGFAMAHTFPAALAWLAGVGFAGGWFVVPLNAYLQEWADQRERGRILATNNFANMLGVIIASGLLWLLHDELHSLSTSAILAGLGLVMIVGGAAIIILLPYASLRFPICAAARLALRIRVEGGGRIPESGGVLLVANHVSYVDAVLLGRLTRRPVRFLMWRPYYEKPVVRKFLDAIRVIPVGSGTPRENVRALDAARAALVAGDIVAIFPEGQVTRDGSVDDFQRGFERIVKNTGCPLIPVNIDGLYGHPLSGKGGGPFRSWERWFRASVTVRVGEPIHRPISATDLRQTILELAGHQAAA